MAEIVIDAPVIHDDMLTRAIRRAIEELGFEPAESEATAKSPRAPFSRR